MIDISVHELHKHYGSNHVLRGVSFEIFSGEKVGLLGKNGAGKTTLFKIIAGTETYESGTLSRASGKRIEVLDQIPVFAENSTVDAILRSSFKDVTAIHDAMQKIEGIIGSDSAALARYGRLMEEYERLGGYDVEFRIDKICNGMNIGEDMRNGLFATLSGGEQTRVNLARILLCSCDILLLDEPTNHLDLASLAWLEGFLREFTGTVVTISHDRVFLDNVITRIIDIADGKAHFYSGNFTWFAQEKQRRYEAQAEAYERQQKEIKRIEDRAKWFVEQNRFTTKHHAILSRLDHMEKVEKPTANRRLTEEFSGGLHTAKEVLSLKAVSKSYGENHLLTDTNLTISRMDRIALIGKNGSGKTTLIRMIMGEEQPDEGEIKVSSNIEAAFLPQIVTFDDEDATVLETLRDAMEVGIHEENKLRGILARFQFRTDAIAKRVRHLSGGEKMRLKLCLLMQSTINFLIMDEPTNHLDIESREWLEEAVAEWGRTMLLISHDRYFLSKFATKIWEMQNSEIIVFDGNFDEYLSTQGTDLEEKKPKSAKPRKARK